MDSDVKEMRFQVLLSEKEHADRYIGSYIELQVKLLGLIGAAVAAGAGYLLVDPEVKLSSVQLGLVFVGLSIISCVAVLQSVITFGIALGYIEYKNRELRPALAELTSAGKTDINAVSAFAGSLTRKPVFAATVALVSCHLVASAGLLLYGLAIGWRGQLVVAAFVLGCLLWLVTLGCQLGLGRAMQNILRADAASRNRRGQSLEPAQSGGKSTEQP